MKFVDKMRVNYRYATSNDIAAIADLHARSWQQHYAGIWQDTYLNGPVVADRLKVWQARMSTPAPNQHIVVAEVDDRLVGFTCLYVNDDTEFGTLLDNLHVSSDFQGKGMGRHLMAMAAKLAHEYASASSLYLWVLEGNHAARKFYERLKGENVETTKMENPDGTTSSVCRYVWTDLNTLC